jgi:hypothetical protein
MNNAKTKQVTMPIFNYSISEKCLYGSIKLILDDKTYTYYFTHDNDGGDLELVSEGQTHYEQEMLEPLSRVISGYLPTMYDQIRSNPYKYIR